MTMTEWKWQSHDGLQMYARRWQPEGQPKALISLVHGHGEHVNRYNHVGEAFAAAGYVMQGYDSRGHGQSGGPRGHTPSYESMLNDTTDFLADARKTYPTLPIFLYGHSMGGNQVINYALRYPNGLRGAIVASPWLQLKTKPAPFLAFLMKIINVIYPTYTQATALDPKVISRDPKEVQAYISDPLVHDKISARLYSVIEANALNALEHANELKIPMLLMHGNADDLCVVNGSKEFAQKAGNLVTLRIWEGLYHETHNEPEKAKVIQMMIDWVGERF